jgi:adenylylsulfate kinase
MSKRKILIMGLPGAGKTTLARIVKLQLGAVLFNADEVRSNINKDLGFSLDDRIEQARRMGWLCDRVVEAGGVAVADFVCPTQETRAAFGDAFVVWVDRIEESRFRDTNNLFVAPENVDLRIPVGGTPEQSAAKVAAAWRRASGEALGTALKRRITRALHIANDGSLPARDVARKTAQPIAYLALCVAIIMLRGAVDVSPFDRIDSVILVSLLGATMMRWGVFAAIVALCCALGVEFFFFEPALTLGVANWSQLWRFAIGVGVSVGAGALASRWIDRPANA